MKASFRFDEVMEALPPAEAGLLERIARVAAARGTPLYLVGGPVRDLLLGRRLRDLDLLVEEDPVPLAEAVVRDAAGGTLSVEAPTRFGTLRITGAETSVDVARARRERYERPGALPEVEPGTLAEDAERRDFTINALALPIDAAARHRAQGVIDPLGGLADLEAGRFAVLHARSFHDDPTRAFRAARLAVRLGLRLERRSRSALRDALRDGTFGAVSGERFRRELALVFEEPHQGVDAGRVLQWLSEMHVLAALEPGLSLPRDRLAPLRRLSRSIERPEWPTTRFRPWVAGFAVWLAPLSAVTRRRTLERLAIRGEQAARILRFGAESEEILDALARARGRGAVDALLGELSEESLQAVFALADVSIRRRIVRWGGEDRRRRPPVVGGDLTALGITGPDVGRGLARIRAAFLDGEIANREEALVLAQELARRSARKPRGGRGAREAKGRRARSDAGGSAPRRAPAVAPPEPILDTARASKTESARAPRTDPSR